MELTYIQYNGVNIYSITIMELISFQYNGVNIYSITMELTYIQ